MSAPAMQHPLVRRAVAGLREVPNAPVQLSPVIAEKLREDLRALFDKPELKRAVEELVTFAFFVEDAMHAHVAAKAILAICTEATEALRAQAKQLADRAQQ